MSACEDCPARHSESYCYSSRCSLGIWARSRFRKDEMPDSCPHVAALRAVVEDDSLVLVAVPKKHRLKREKRWRPASKGGGTTWVNHLWWHDPDKDGE